MKLILALVLLLITSSIFARSLLCEAKLVNTFSRTQLGSITIRDGQNKLISQIQRSNGTTLTSSSINRVKFLKKGEYQFENFLNLLKDNHIKISGLKTLNVRKIDFVSLDLNFVTGKTVKFISSNDGYIFGVCK